MAEHKLKGQDFILKIDPAGGTSYDTIVCLKSVKFNSKDGEVDASSFCGVEILPGITVETVTFEGIQDYDPASGKSTGVDLYVVKQFKAKISWQITPVTPVTGDPIKTGKGYLLSLDEDYSLDSPTTFSAEIKVAGAVVQTITV